MLGDAEVPSIPHVDEGQTSTSTAPVIASSTPAKKMLESAPAHTLEAAWKSATATVFWVGESATTENGYIHNDASAWDGEWRRRFGGVDDPDDRCGYSPCAFIPMENPFYVALPYNDRDDMGEEKQNARTVPWYATTTASSILKDRWVEVRAATTTCFAQWEDVGPFEEDDVVYVFGKAQVPKNQHGLKAGIDLSPALRDCLGVGGVSSVIWRHVETKSVPAGPWKDIVTN